jgi:transposase InsO family protein
VIDRPNQVWCADITYIPMRRGFHYLIAIMDWSTRKVRWTRKIGQEVKLGLLLRRTDLNDGQTEAVFGGIQGEGCS